MQRTTAINGNDVIILDQGTFSILPVCRQQHKVTVTVNSSGLVDRATYDQGRRAEEGNGTYPTSFGVVASGMLLVPKFLSQLSIVIFARCVLSKLEIKFDFGGLRELIVTVYSQRLLSWL